MCLRVALAAVLAAPAARADDHWPRFRGPTGSGTADGQGLPAAFGPDKNVAWKTDIPGYGWSSPIAWGDKVFVTSFVTPDAAAAPKLGFYLQPGKIPTGDCRWVVLCLDRKTGKVVWEKTAHTGRPDRPVHPKNSYAAETPSTDGERVYAYFGNLGVFCYDLGGKELWSRRLESAPTRSDWGPGAAPVLHKGRLYVVNDNEKRSYLLALDAKTGEEVWRVEREEKSSWATPFVWETEKRTEIVTCATGGVRSYDLDGKMLWQLGPMSEICIPTPVAAHGLLYASSGYEFGNKTRPIYAVRPGAAGDISPKGKESGAGFVAWSLPSSGAYTPSPLVYGDHLYVLYSQGFLTCLDAKSGKELYVRERLGGTYSASPWAYDGRVYCLAEDGTVTAVTAGPKFEAGEKVKLGEPCLATPALAGRGLLVRTQTKLYRFESPAGK